MFENIEQMEKEIESFRKNMMASSELVKGIEELTETTKKQKDSFSASSENLVRKIDSCIEQIKDNNNDALHNLSNNNNDAINTLHEKMAEEQTAHIKELDRIKAELVSMQEKYAEELQKTEQTIQNYQTESEEKYNNFIQRLENMNMDSLVKEVQDMKQSFQKKFLIMMGGMAATLLVVILELLGL